MQVLRWQARLLHLGNDGFLALVDVRHFAVLGVRAAVLDSLLFAPVRFALLLGRFLDGLGHMAMPMIEEGKTKVRTKRTRDGRQERKRKLTWRSG